MKKIIKFFPLALAALTVAGCSNDDFFGESNAEKKNILVVENEPELSSTTTRAATPYTGTTVYFLNEDVIKVYDNECHKYDTYTYDGENFIRKSGDQTNLSKAAQFAMFPGDKVIKGYWDDEKGTLAEIEIPELITYDEKAEVTAGGAKAYLNNLPRWGTVDGFTEAGNPKTTLKFLTGILRINVPNALGNATFLRISTGNDLNLSGTFLATLDPENVDNVTLKQNDALTSSKYLYVDLTKAPSDAAVINVPIIDGAEDVVIEASADATAANYNATGAGTPSWTTAYTLDGYTFARQHRKTIDFKYKLSINKPSGITAALEQYKTNTDDVTLALVKSLDMTDNTDLTAQVPSMACDNVVINLVDDATTAAVSAASTPDALTIEDADAEKPYQGTITLNVGTVNTTAPKLPVVINLKKANVILVGNFSDNNSTITVTEANSLTIGTSGDDDAATTVGAGAVTIAKLAESLTVEKKATVGTSLDATGDGAKSATITINGAVTGDVSGGANVTVNAEITGTTTAKGDLSISKAGKVATAVVSGNATIDLEEEGEAVTTKLTMKGEAKTVYMKQGYVKEIATDFTALGTENDTKLTIDFTGNKLVAIHTVSKGQTTDEIEMTTSKWDGQIPTATMISGYVDATNNNVYTATQLTTYMGTDAETINIMNDIDLNNDPEGKWLQPINGDATNGLTINGNNHTISNINLSNFPDEKYQSDNSMSIAGVGFIGKAAGFLTVSDLTLDNVQFTKDYNNQQAGKAKTFKVAGVGGLAGEVTGAITLSGVTVNLAADFGYSSYTAKSGQKVETDATLVGIGGLVGIAGGAATLSKVVVNGALIQGYTSLGGFIGVTTEDITIDKDCKSNITAFKSNYGDSSASNIEMNYGRIGGAVGYVAAAKNVTIAYGATTNDVVATLPAGAEGKLYVSVKAGSGYKLWSWSRNQQWIGFSASEAAPGTAIGTVSIGKSATESDEYVTPTFDATSGALDDIATGKKALYAWTAKAN